MMKIGMKQKWDFTATVNGVILVGQNYRSDVSCKGVTKAENNREVKWLVILSGKH
jgi:hypothetical protein